MGSFHVRDEKFKLGPGRWQSFHVWRNVFYRVSTILVSRHEQTCGRQGCFFNAASAAYTLVTIAALMGDNF
ncbi:hypothetical protein Tco_1102087 [Tanacetum coccineum]